MSIGQIIRNRRKELGLTQDQVARRVDISKPYLSNIETGSVSNPPSDGKLAALERVLQIQPGELRRLAHLARTPDDIRQEHEDLSAELRKLRGVVRQFVQQARQDDQAPRGEFDGLDAEDIAAMLSDSAGPGPAVGQVVPIINSVAAGYPQHFTDLDYPAGVADEYLRCPDVHDEHAFAARVTGDSMAPRYSEGDIVIFSPSRQANSGDDCFVRFAEDEGTTFKRFYLDDADSSDGTYEKRRIRLQPLNSAYPAQSYPPEQITGLWPAVFRIEKLC